MPQEVANLLVLKPKFVAQLRVLKGLVTVVGLDRSALIFKSKIRQLLLHDLAQHHDQLVIQHCSRVVLKAKLGMALLELLAPAVNARDSTRVTDSVGH
jgi:hypothetical protein